MKLLFIYLILPLCLIFNYEGDNGLLFPSYSDPIFVSEYHFLVQPDTTQQCKGIASSTGKRCKLRTSNANGYCYHHQDQAGTNAIPPAQRNAKQCLGYAKSTSQQCKNKTTNQNGYCYIHQDQAPGYERKEPKTDYVGRCNAITKSGTRCKRTAQSGSRYCWQHQK